MLALSRRPGESLVLIDEHTGVEINIKFVALRGQVGRFGIAAPDHIRVAREEQVSLLDDLREMAKQVKQQGVEIKPR